MPEIDQMQALAVTFFSQADTFIAKYKEAHMGEDNQDFDNWYEHELDMQLEPGA